MKRTKIVCTLGPSSSSEKVLEQMLLAGMNVARVNFSHGTHEENHEVIERFRKVRDKLDISAAVLLDTKGPEIRLGDFKEAGHTLEKGQTFTLTTRKIIGSADICTISYKDFPFQIHTGTDILIDDGRVRIRAQEITKTDVICKVMNGGKVSSRKGVNVPKIHLDLKYLSSIDKKDLLFGIKHDVDYVAASFVRDRQDVLDVRSFLDKNGGEKIKIISKIENMEGINNFKEILACSDGIMVARGDMGVEVNYAKLPGIQKKLIKECCQTGKIVITATQMLESMINSRIPTRADITDVANAVYDGTSAVMLSSESAIGKYPVETVRAMAKIAIQAESDAFEHNTYDIIDYKMDPKDYSNAIAHSVCDTAANIDAKLILTVTKSGDAALMISKFKPTQSVIAATPQKKTFYQLALVWGVDPLLTKYEKNWDKLIAGTFEDIKKSRAAKTGDVIVLTAGVPLEVCGMANLIRIETL